MNTDTATEPLLCPEHHKPLRDTRRGLVCEEAAGEPCMRWVDMDPDPGVTVTTDSDRYVIVTTTED